MTFTKFAMAAAAVLFCSAAQAETTAPAKRVQFAQASGACTMIYLPVCGVVKGKPTDFSNECEAKLAKAKNITSGPCNKPKI